MNRPHRSRLHHAIVLALALQAAAPVMAQTATGETGASGQVTELDKVSVVGARTAEASIAIGTDQVRNTVALDHRALLSAPAGTTGLKVLETLPGFNVQTNDALGLYENSSTIFVRSFNQQQIGFVVDGIPIGRSDLFGGGAISRYVENENLDRVIASQGAGDVAQPSYSSLGPVVQYFSLRPSSQAGVVLSQTFGSDNLKRSFIKLESGEHRGFSSYLSRSKLDNDLWRGPGSNDREHVEAKLLFRSQAGHELQFKYIYNDYFDYDSPSITRAQFNGTANDPFGRSGRYFGYLAFVPDLPETVPGVTYSNTAYNQYYKQAINQRTDHLYGLGGRFALSARADLDISLYYEDKTGYGVSPEAYATSLSSYNAQRNILPGLYAPLGLQYGLSTVDNNRTGATLGVSYQGEAHTVQAGIWVERDEYHRLQARFNQVGGNPAGEPLLDQPVHRQREYNSVRDTLQLYLKDTWRLLDERLILEYGIKALDIDYRISGHRNPADYILGRQPTIRDHWRDAFLPQAGAVYNFGRNQAFASYSRTLALPRGADDIYSLASPGTPGPDAEAARNLELGVRTNQATFNGVVAVYQTRYDNRLESYAAEVPGSSTTETFFQNVGAVEARGIELSGVWKPHALGGDIVFNGSLTRNSTRFEDDFSTYRIAGRTVPDSPRWLAQSGLTWETPWAVLNLSGRYVSERYTNYVNTDSLSGYALYTAYIDFGGDRLSLGALKGLKVRLNIDNLFDKTYFGSINSTVDGVARFRPGSDRTYQLTFSVDI